MDWKTKLVLPPNYVSLRHLKELREKEKAELELKIREEAEAEYRFRLEEEERLKKLKEDEEERLKEEEENMKREKEEEERLRREMIRRDQILRTRTLLCGEPYTTRIIRKDFMNHSDDAVNQEEIKKEIVSEVAVIKDENLEEGMKKNRRWGRKWGKGKKKVNELEFHGLNKTPKSEKKSESQGIFDKKIVMNQSMEEIDKKIGDLNLDEKKKVMMMKSKDVKQYPQTKTGYLDKDLATRIKNFSKHGKHIGDAMYSRNASTSALEWVSKTDS